MILFNYATGSKTLTANIYNNYIYGDLGVGSPTGFIYCAQNASCTMYNNLLVNTGHRIYGIMWTATGNSCDKFYNNTIVGMTGDFGITLGTGAITSGGCKVAIENNIVSGVTLGINDYGALTSDVGTSNYNVWVGSPQMGTNDSTYLSYTTWKGDGFDANSVTTNPSLGGNFNISSAASSAHSAGTNLTSLGISTLNLDKAGIARPASAAWDAGVYQYSSAVAALADSNQTASAIQSLMSNLGVKVNNLPTTTKPFSNMVNAINEFIKSL
jgi:hypothetical protein